MAIVTGVPSGRRIVPDSITPFAIVALVTVVFERSELTIVVAVPKTFIASKIEPLIVAFVMKESVTVEFARVVLLIVEEATEPPISVVPESVLSVDVALMSEDVVIVPPVTAESVNVAPLREALVTLPPSIDEPLVTVDDATRVSRATLSVIAEPVMVELVLVALVRILSATEPPEMTRFDAVLLLTVALITEDPVTTALFEMVEVATVLPVTDEFKIIP